MKWLGLVFLLVTTAAAGPRRKRADAAPVPAPAASDAVDPFDDLAALLADLVPRVEKAAGRSFLTPPVVAVAEPDILKKMLSEEEALVSASVLRDTPPEIRALRAEQAGSGSAALLGKYGIFEKRLFLCPDNLRAATAAAGLPVSAVGDMVRVVLAHELTHALHDQHVDLERLVRGLEDQDALWAASSTWEGLATWVSERVAYDLGLTEIYVVLASLQGWSPTGLEAKTAYPVWALYGRGRDAVAWHFEHGGLDRVWAVAARPPERSAGLFRPETWPSARTPPVRDYPGVLRGTDQLLTKGDWVVGISMLGEFELRGEAVLGDNEAVFDEILAHLVDAWQMTGTRPDRKGHVRVLVFDEASWPRKYLDALRTQQQADAELLAGQVGREVEVVFEPFDAVRADLAYLRSSRIAEADGVFSERHAAWVVRGKTVVDVTAVAFRPGLRLGWTVDEVFARLDAAPALAPKAVP